MGNEGIFLYGASGHAKVIREIVEAQGNNVLGVVDDNLNLEYFGSLRVSHSAANKGPFIICVGDNKIRKRIVESLKCNFGKALHPFTALSCSAMIGDGTVIMASAVINAETVVGEHCIINTGATVGHECRLGNYVQVSPHATLCGNVKVGEGSWIGAGAVVIQGIKIGKWSIVGAGAVVTRDVPDYTEVVGVPARPVKSLDKD